MHVPLERYAVYSVEFVATRTVRLLPHWRDRQFGKLAMRHEVIILDEPFGRDNSLSHFDSRSLYSRDQSSFVVYIFKFFNINKYGSIAGYRVG